MGLFGSNRNDDSYYEPQDTLIVLNDNGTADLMDVTSINDERIHAGPWIGEDQISVPIQDVRQYVGKKGRVFLYPSTVENVTDCRRIAQLEVSTVMRQITHFEREQDPPAKPISKLLLMGIALVIVIIIIAVAS